MNLQHHDLARTITDARHLRRWLPGTAVARLLVKRRTRRLRRRPAQAPAKAIAIDVPRPPPVTGRAGERPNAPAAELGVLLDRVAQLVVEAGTVTEAGVLEELSGAVMQDSPGAAAALVDWRGSEIARLRAFGIVHGVVLHTLGPHRQAALLARLRGGTDLPLAG